MEAQKLRDETRAIDSIGTPSSHINSTTFVNFTSAVFNFMLRDLKLRRWFFFVSRRRLSNSTNEAMETRADFNVGERSCFTLTNKAEILVFLLSIL